MSIALTTIPTSWSSGPLAVFTYAMTTKGTTGVEPAGAAPLSGDAGAPLFLPATGSTLDDAVAQARQLAVRTDNPFNETVGVLQATDGTRWLTRLQQVGKTTSPPVDGSMYGMFVKNLAVSASNADLRAVVGGYGWYPVDGGTAGAYRQLVAPPNLGEP